MTHTEALKLAIKALEHHVAQTRPIHSTSETIDALRAALAQPEQEPVAVLLEYENGERELRFKNNGWPAKETPLYTHLPRRKWRGLTEEELRPLCKQLWVFETVKQWAQAIEAALKEKNHE